MEPYPFSPRHIVVVGDSRAIDTTDDFTDFVARRWGRLVRAAFLLGCSKTEAEDVTQATLERCMLNWRRVRLADNVDAYVHRMLINSFKSSRRRMWTREVPTADFTTFRDMDQLQHVDRADAVGRALGQLPETQRTVVVLKYYSQFTEQEIAAVLNIALGTVKSRLSRARESMSQNPHLIEWNGV